MDLRGLDPFINNPPGRAGNLYDTFGGLSTGIDETPTGFFKELPSEIQCSFASTGGTNLCFQNHSIPRKELIPQRRIQFDPNIDDMRVDDSPVPFISPPAQSVNTSHKFLIPVMIIFILLVFV